VALAPQTCAFLRKRPLAIPPTTPQRLKQGRRVRVSISLRLRETKHCLLIGLLRIQQCEVSHRPKFDVAAHRHQTLLCGLFSAQARTQRLCVELQGSQRIRDVLESGQNGAAVLSSRLVEFRLRGREKSLLSKLDLALKKIDDSTFGICEICEEQIGKKRLEARPETTLCIKCKEDQEREERTMG